MLPAAEITPTKGRRSASSKSHSSAEVGYSGGEEVSETSSRQLEVLSTAFECTQSRQLASQAAVSLDSIIGINSEAVAKDNRKLETILSTRSVGLLSSDSATH